MLTLFAELPRVEQNGSGTSPSSNVLPLGQLLCLPGMHCLRRSINCSPKRRKKKKVPLCTHRWTQHGMMANSCIILFSTYGDSAFLGTRRPLRAKALTNSGACLFAFSAGALQSQTGRLGFHSRSGRGLVSSVMDRPVVLHAEIPSSFREQEGRTGTSSITLTLTFCALAAGGDEESCPRISLATFFFVTSHEGAACKKYLPPLFCDAAASDKQRRSEPPRTALCHWAACIYDKENRERQSFQKKKGHFGPRASSSASCTSTCASACFVFASLLLARR